jgi:hypothetical protein
MNKEIRLGLAWGGGIVLLALGATLAHRQGYIDHDTVRRVVIGANGLMIAFYGNRGAKAVAPSAFAGQIARVAGWALVLSGLIYAGLWAFAPIPLAITVGCGAVAVGLIVTLGYSIWLRAHMDASMRA